MLDWYMCIPAGAGTAAIVAVWGDWLAHQGDGASGRRVGLYVGVPALGLLALVVGGTDHAQLQWLQVLGLGIAVGATLTALCTALVALVPWAWVIVAGDAVLLALGALTVVNSANEHSWCLQYGSLSTLGNCLGSLFGTVLGWLLLGCGAVLGLVLCLRLLDRHRSQTRISSRP